MPGIKSFWKIDNPSRKQYIKASNTGHPFQSMGEIVMRITAIAVIGLALTLGGCQAQAESVAEETPTEAPSPEHYSVQMHPSMYETESGEIIAQTLVFVDGLRVPGASEGMIQPFLSGRFVGNELVPEETLACDANAPDIEASCVAVPANQQSMATDLLNSLFDRFAADAWADYVDQIDKNNERPENFPSLQSPLGVTNTT